MMKRARAEECDGDDCVICENGLRRQSMPVYDETLLFAAARDGREQLVRVLLENPLIDPSLERNEALYIAVSHGHTDVVKLLLADPRVNPGDRSGLIVQAAIVLEDCTIARLLLADPRVDPTQDDNSAIFWAAYYDVPDVLQVLLDDPRVDATGAIKHARGRSLRLLATHDHWGVRNYREIFERWHHPALVVAEYDAIISQCHAMGFVAKQLAIWESLVEPLADRLKASF